MKTLSAGIRNYQTTIIGAVLSGAMVAQEHIDGDLTLTNPKTWIAVLIAVLGFLVRDASKSSEESNIKSIAVLGALCFLLPSCGTTSPVTGSLIFRDADSGAKGGLVFTKGQPVGVVVKVPIYDENDNLIGQADLEYQHQSPTVIHEK